MKNTRLKLQDRNTGPSPISGHSAFVEAATRAETDQLVSSVPTSSRTRSLVLCATAGLSSFYKSIRQVRDPSPMRAVPNGSFVCINFCMNMAPKSKKEIVCGNSGRNHF
jgi:hypothetical protein